MKLLRNIVTKNKIIAYIVLSVLIVVGVTIGFSSAFFVSTLDVNNNVVSTECFILMLEDRHDINLEKAYPMSEEEGTNLIPYKFTISNVCNAIEDYQVNIETIASSTMDSKYVRYKLDNAPSKKIGEQEEVETYVNDGISDSRKIATGTLRNNESITYNLRIWVDEETTTEQAADKIFRSKVVVLSEPKQEITMHSNGGTVEINPVRKTIGKAIGELEVPRRAGYDFEDWYVNEELTNKVLESTVVTNQLTDLYAKWQARNDTRCIVEHYQMDTEGNYPETPYESEELYGTSDTNVTPETKVYEHFTSPAKQTVNINADGSQVVKYYYERNKYTQTTEARYMDISGEYGSYSTIETKDVYYGAKYSYSSAETTEYSGVSVDEYTVSGAQTNQVSFERRKYAQTTEGRYMDTSGEYGEYSTIETKDVYYGAKYSYSSPETVEYSGVSVDEYTVSGAQTNQVSFERRKYTQTTEGRYMDTSGEYGEYSIVETQDVYYGAKYSYLKAATTEYAAVSVVEYIVTEPKTNQVSFERRKYTQTTQGRYMDTSGNYPTTYDTTLDTQDVYYGVTYSYSKEATVEYAAASVEEYTVNGSQTNKISFARNKYTIIYNANGGSVSPTSEPVYYNATTKLPTPTRTGYSNQGWWTAASGGTKFGNAGATYTVTTAKTMYAQWSANTFTVAYNGNGNTGGSRASHTCTYNGTCTLAANGFTKTGYTFAGWKKANTGSTLAAGTSIKNAATSGTVTYYAQWTANTFTVAYNGNGNTGGSRASHTCTYNGTCTLAANGFTKTGHTFAGWKKANTGSTLAAGTSIKNAATSGTVTYYAQWNVNSYTLTYNANGGSVSPTSKSVNYGAKYGTLPTPSRSGYSFQGWFTASSGGSSVSANTTMGAGNTTIYAQWKSNSPSPSSGW